MVVYLHVITYFSMETESYFPWTIHEIQLNKEIKNLRKKMPNNSISANAKSQSCIKT